MQDDGPPLSDTEEEEESFDPQKPSENPEQVFLIWVSDVYNLYASDLRLLSTKYVAFKEKLPWCTMLPCKTIENYISLLSL